MIRASVGLALANACALTGVANFRLIGEPKLIHRSRGQALGEVYADLSFITFRLAFTSFFTNAIGTGLPTGKLTMAFVVA